MWADPTQPRTVMLRFVFFCLNLSQFFSLFSLNDHLNYHFSLFLVIMPFHVFLSSSYLTPCCDIMNYLRPLCTFAPGTQLGIINLGSYCFLVILAFSSHWYDLIISVALSVDINVSFIQIPQYILSLVYIFIHQVDASLHSNLQISTVCSATLGFFILLHLFWFPIFIIPLFNLIRPLVQTHNETVIVESYLKQFKKNSCPLPVSNWFFLLFSVPLELRFKDIPSQTMLSCRFKRTFQHILKVYLCQNL